MKFLKYVLAVILAASPLFGQSGQAQVGPTTLAVGPTVPSSCSGPTIFYKNSTTTGMYYCDTASSTFKAITGADANGVTAAATLTNGIPVLGVGGKAVASGPVNLADSNSVTGILGFANGQVGATLFGFCAGTVGTATTTTYGLAPFSNTTACTSAIGGNNEQLPPFACTARNLAAHATVGGATAGSGVITLYKNSVATALTCTLGTGSNAKCTDTNPAHAVALLATDQYSLRVTTNQASDTTANPYAVFVCSQ